MKVLHKDQVSPNDHAKKWSNEKENILSFSPFKTNNIIFTIYVSGLECLATLLIHF